MDSPTPREPPDRLHSAPAGAQQRRPSPILHIPSTESISTPHSADDAQRPASAPPLRANFPYLPPPPGIQIDPPPPVARTPRRVQWTADHVINVEPPANEPGPDLDHVNNELERFRTEAEVSSAVTLPSDDYDYRLDTDEKRDHDAQAEALLNEDRDAGRKEQEDDTLHKILGSSAADHVAGYVQLGETDGLPSRGDEKAQDLREASNIVKWTQLRRRATVRRKHRHESTPHPLHHPDNGGSAHSEDTVAQLAAEKETTPPPPPPPPRANPPLNPPPGTGLPHMPGGTSVLATLLAVYGQQNQADSATTSAATTPQSSRPPSIASSDDDDHHHRRHFWQRGRPKTPPAPHNSGAHSGSPGFGDKHRSRSQGSIADRTPDERPGIFGSVARAVENMYDDRPKSARSSAGVFGALIQNSAAMAAAAAPTSATIMPAAKRPGYHIDRYELSSEPTSPRERIGPLSRPSSVVGLVSHRGRSTSPKRGRTPSPLGYGKRTDSPSAMDRRPASTTRLGSFQGEADSTPPSLYSAQTNDHARSSDNLLMIKPKKRPAPLPQLSLKAVRSAEHWLTSRSESTMHLNDDERRRKDEEDRKRKEWESEKRRRKKAKEARKKQEVFIIQHVAAILARQQFIMKLARALMMFGSPSHRLETQIQATARVLDISAQVVYLPSVMLISFADDATHTSDTKFLKQSTGLDLGKLLLTHNLYWEVVHDRMSVDDANTQLDTLMTMPPCYNWWQNIIVAGFCSAIIVIPSYYGSFIDALMSAALGMLLMVVQTFAAKNDLFSGVFEVAISTLISVLAAALASTHRFCYTSLVSGGIVLVLPGYIVLTGALEISSRNITAGAVRMGYSVIYSLLLGFGISMGAEVYIKIRGEEVANATDNTCSRTHYDGAPWFQQTPSGYWYYLCVPAFAFVLSMNCQQPILTKEMPVMVAIACAGWVVNHFSGQYAFTGRSDIVSAIGAFCVGILGNLYGRFFSNGASFPVMVTGILMQLPSGLKEGGLFNFAANTDNGTFAQYSTGFSVASQLISVALGLTVGLFCAAVVTHPLGGSRRRGAGIFSF